MRREKSSRARVPLLLLVPLLLWLNGLKAAAEPMAANGSMPAPPQQQQDGARAAAASGSRESAWQELRDQLFASQVVSSG